MDTSKNKLIKNTFTGYTLIKLIKALYTLLAFNTIILPIIIIFEIILSFAISMYGIKKYIQNLDNSLSTQHKILS